MPRRRSDDDPDYVDLRAPEHEWWAKRPTDPFAPVEREKVEEPEPEPPEPEPEPAIDDAEDLPPGILEESSDPYAVLRLAPDAPWEDIVTSYRRLARWWHPDGLGAAAEWGRAACETKIRQLNAAYAELRVRRGR